MPFCVLQIFVRALFIDWEIHTGKYLAYGLRDCFINESHEQEPKISPIQPDLTPSIPISSKLES